MNDDSSPVRPGAARRKSARVSFALVGLLAGLALPAATIALRFAVSHADFSPDVFAHRVFYLSEVVAAAVIGAAFGSVAGARLDAVRNRRDWYREKSDHDDETGLLAPSAFRRALGGAIERARSSRQPMTLLLIGIEGIAGAENERGPQLTRAVLLHAASAIRHVCSPADPVGRRGGVEIAVVLDDCNSHAAERVAFAIQERIADRPVLDAGNRTSWKGLAAGVSGIPEATAETLLHRAQEALATVHAAGDGVLLLSA